MTILASDIQAERATRFHELHASSTPLRLVNAWDGLSARVFATAGAPAIGTSSFAVAYAHGYPDGQQIPWSQVCDTVAAMTAAVDVPVTADIEAGQGAQPDAVAVAVGDVIDRGAVGINLEDSRPGEPGALFTIDAQCERIAAARARADAAGLPLFINARCDVYFGASVPPEEQLDAARTRGARYVDAGADGIFLPGLTDASALREVVDATRAPLNVMHWPGLPAFDELCDIGVRRISQGASAFLYAVAGLERLATAYLNDAPDDFGGDLTPAFHLLQALAYR
jgi:2-methylisocitrate lyase-like PEP mutase family enzyme